MREARYDINDTIFAISSPSSDQRVILRISGSEAIKTCSKTLRTPLELQKVGQAPPYILRGSIAIDAELNIDAKLYLFFAPHSYTGDNVVEIHLDTNSAVLAVLQDFSL